MPPDTNGAPGLTQYVQSVNTVLGVFDKSTGALLAGPISAHTIWQGFGGDCETSDNGDGTVSYDRLANRWVFAVMVNNAPNSLHCVAVSTTPDATGTYNRYAFLYSVAIDYPKMGVWPDAYYASILTADSNGNFTGANACAYDRNAMLNGLEATQICLQQSMLLGGLLPSDLDGSTPPPAGSPNFFLTFGANSLNMFKFHVDFAVPANSTFTGPTVLPVANIDPLCFDDICVRQPDGDTQWLDPVADRLMYRLAYRNFGSHESMVVNQSVFGGIRWYEIQNPNGVPVVAQQSTFGPDANYRWMGSIAMDGAGDIALGYSESNATSLFPSVFFTGRTASDPINTMGTESSIVLGGGSQEGHTRWGDYSAMQIDPVDDCTFWYTQEYLQTTGDLNWSTIIAKFKFPNCVPAPPPPVFVHRAFLPNVTGATWSDEDLTAVTGGTSPTLSSRLSGFQDSRGEHMFFVGADQDMHHLFFDGSKWSDENWTAFTGQASPRANSPLISFADPSGGEHVYYISTGNNARRLSFNNPAFEDANLTGLASAGPVSSGSGLSAFSDSSGEHVFYLTSDQHVHHLHSNRGVVAWSDDDLTNIAESGVLAGQGSALTSFSGTTGPVVFFIADNQHVHMIFFDATSHWGDFDMTVFAGSVLAAPGSALSSIVVPEPIWLVYYVATDQHIHLLAESPSSPFTDIDLTARTAGPLASPGGGLSTIFETILYLATNQHIHWITSFVDQDLTAVSGAALTTPGSALSSFFDTQLGEHVFFLSPVK